MNLGLIKRIFNNRSWSQEGEDKLLSRFFNEKPNGFYVDVGAHHPKRFSNTYFFYKMGWKGICVDTTPGFAQNFRRVRPRDLTIEIGIGTSNENSTLFEFSDPALNTLDPNRADYLIKNTDYLLVKKTAIKCKSLESILDEYSIKNDIPTIDFMTIDVEGYELKVLTTNNFVKYKPNILIVEIINFNIEEYRSHPIYQYLSQFDYEIRSVLYHSVFFVQKNLLIRYNG